MSFTVVRRIIILNLETLKERRRHNKFKRHRREGTLSEMVFWEGLKRKCKLYNIDFPRKQYIVFPYILDFFFFHYGIGIEIDGEYHEKRIEYDSRRDGYLANLGLLIIHLSNFVIQNHLEEAIDLVIKALLNRKDYLPSVQFQLTNLENSSFGKTEKGQCIRKNILSRRT